MHFMWKLWRNFIINNNKNQTELGTKYFKQYQFWHLQGRRPKLKPSVFFGLILEPNMYVYWTMAYMFPVSDNFQFKKTLSPKSNNTLNNTITTKLTIKQKGCSK